MIAMKNALLPRFSAVFTFLISAAFTLVSSMTMAQDSTAVAAAGGDPAVGEKLWKANCAACHKVDAKLIGPALGQVTEKYDEEWLISWIRNNQELRESGDAQAIAIYEEYNGLAMPNYPQFSDDDIRGLLAYIDQSYAEKMAPTVAEGDGGAVAGGGQAAGGLDIVPVLAGLVVFLIIIVFILVRIKNLLLVMKGVEPRSFVDQIFDLRIYLEAFAANKKLVGFAVVIVLIFAFNGLWGFLKGIGVEQNYQPTQPIAFSHEIHAGQNQVDCNYCHSSARHSKSAGVPSANVCMNCHMYIAEGQSEQGTKEIEKIYAAIGWDKDSRAYIEDYEEKPIEWVRIHNLPDLAYFNHSQHVVAGQVECQTCHGPIEEMEEVYQYSSLTMGWCINCHRETEVKMEDNPYYDKLHDQLAEQYKGEKITVDKIGGLECGKCHY
ncbi:c-type cytochrome [Cryomorphaceae bacterium]|nr:c-type cytochrome [Cryomorphaceae bacterium]